MLSWCRERGKATGSYALPAQRVKEVGLGLCSALFHIHNTAQIVHHDIKLANIIIMADGVAKVRRWILQNSGVSLQVFWKIIHSYMCQVLM